MNAAEKKYQKISSSQSRTANAKYLMTRSKFNTSSINDYLDYMEEENFKDID